MKVPKTRRFTVDEYYRMAEAGILREDDRVELLNGEIVRMSPIGKDHAACVDVLTELFVALVRGRAQVRIQGPVRLGRHGEPQPDVALLGPRADRYRSGHPEPPDVLLVVEVADTSLDYDREVKIPEYARAGISEAWLVDLVGEAVEVHRDPAPDGYRDVRRARRGETVDVAAFPGIEIGVDDILGAP